jgi:hypothetical protein
MAKGIELPVNVMVIIAIAVIVLLGLVALFTFGIRSGVPLQIQLEKGTACTSLVNSGCADTSPDNIDLSIDVTGDGKVTKKLAATAEFPADTLQGLCDKYFNTGKSEAACKRVCGCTGI